MKKLFLGVLAVALVIAAAPVAKADAITGSVALGGTNTYSLTGITFKNPGIVLDATGSLAIMLASPKVTMNSFNFATAAGTKLFDWNPGSVDINLTVESLSVMFDVVGKKGFLNVLGTGILEETGKDPTLYDFSLTSTNTGLISFTVDAAPTVPEPGSLLLLGSGLLGVALLLFRKARKPVPTIPL